MSRPFKALIFSLATAHRFTLVAFIGALCNVLFTTAGWPAVINWTVFIIACTLLTKFYQHGALPALTLTGWRKIIYWGMLIAITFIGIALLNLAYATLGLIVTTTIIAVKLAIIIALVFVFITAGLLNRFTVAEQSN